MKLFSPGMPLKKKTLNALLEKARDDGLILQSADGQRFLLVSVEDWHSYEVGDTDNFEEEVVKSY